MQNIQSLILKSKRPMVVLHIKFPKYLENKILLIYSKENYQPEHFEHLDFKCKIKKENKSFEMEKLFPTIAQFQSLNFWNTLEGFYISLMDQSTCYPAIFIFKRKLPAWKFSTAKFQMYLFQEVEKPEIGFAIHKFIQLWTGQVPIGHKSCL